MDQSVQLTESADASAEVTIGNDNAATFNGLLCIHARVCVTPAPATFLADVEGPWIRPDATKAEEVAVVLGQCPSRALTYIPRTIVADPEAHHFGQKLDDRSLMPGDAARLGAAHFEWWLTHVPPPTTK